jgi:hypothetical protein
MRFHASSFLLGVGLTTAFFKAGHRLRPIAVEVTALGVHLARTGRSIVEREREDLEDAWAEVEEHVRRRVEGGRKARAHARHNGQAHARA